MRIFLGIVPVMGSILLMLYIIHNCKRHNLIKQNSLLIMVLLIFLGTVKTFDAVTGGSQVFFIDYLWSFYDTFVVVGFYFLIRSLYIYQYDK